MSLSEFDLIRRYFSSMGEGAGVVTGVGDDCAVLAVSPNAELCTSIDTMVESVHFPVNADAKGLGWRCLAAAVSDLGACGASPLGFCLALTLPAPDESWLSDFAEGLSEASRYFAIPLVGGDTTRGPLTLSLQVFGETPKGKALLRSAAQPGDDIWVSGCLGDARAALDFLDVPTTELNVSQRALLDQYYSPRPPLTFARTLPGVAHACIDISDGLLADLGHIIEQSGAGADLQLEALPLSDAMRSNYSEERAMAYALAGGDDYQLCFTVEPGQSESIKAQAAECGIAVQRIGSIREKGGIDLTRFGQTVSREEILIGQAGYQHFS